MAQGIISCNKRSQSGTTEGIIFPQGIALQYGTVIFNDVEAKKIYDAHADFIWPFANLDYAIIVNPLTSAPYIRFASAYNTSQNYGVIYFYSDTSVTSISIRWMAIGHRYGM